MTTRATVHCATIHCAPGAARLALAGGVLLASGACSAPEPTLRPGFIGLDRHGIQIREWRVESSAGEILAAIDARADGAAADEETLARLELNGFRLARVPIDRVAEVLADLAEPSYDVDGWHGQVLEWQVLAERAVDPAAPAVTVDGRARRLESGRLRLMFRGWSVPMEDGPVLSFALRPDHERSRPRRYEEILGKTTFRGERFESLTFEITLDRAWAYLIAGAAPGAMRRTGESRGGPQSVGPDAQGPPTLGEFILAVPGPSPETRAGAPPSRTILVVVPVIPRELYPSEGAIARLDTDRRARAGR